MKTLRKIAWSLWVILGGSIVAWTLGLVLGPIFLYLVLSGRIIIRGYWRLVWNVLLGRRLILTNHPSIIAETFLLGGALFPLYFIFPWTVLWTMPDERLLKGWWKVFSRWPLNKLKAFELTVLYLRCIVVDRSKKQAGGRGALETKEILGLDGTVVVNPEKGRTFGEGNRNKCPVEYDGRVMQKISDTGMTKVAYEARAWILPGWIEVPYTRQLLKFKQELWLLLSDFKHGPIIYNFRRPSYRIRGTFDREKENKRLQDEIMRA